MFVLWALVFSVETYGFVCYTKYEIEEYVVSY